MGQCISWDRRKSIWALRILSEVLLCSGIVALVAAFTLEQSKPNIYLMVASFCLFLFDAVGLVSSFCLSHDGKKAEKHPVHSVILPSNAGSSVPTDPSIISAQILANQSKSGFNPVFASMKSIPVDSLHSEAPKTKSKKYGSKNSDRLSSINEMSGEKSRSKERSKNSTDSTSDEGFNSGNQSPEAPDAKKKRRRSKRPQPANPTDLSRNQSSSNSEQYFSRI